MYYYSISERIIIDLEKIFAMSKTEIVSKEGTRYAITFVSGDTIDVFYDELYDRDITFDKISKELVTLELGKRSEKKS